MPIPEAYPSVLCSGRASSIAIILLGSLWYTWIKHVESQPAAAAAAQSKAHYAPVPLDDLEEGKGAGPREHSLSAHRHSQSARDARD